MYFRNVSETKSVTVRTAVGIIGIKPGEVIELNEKLYPPLPSTLKKISEEEYQYFRTAKHPDIKSFKKDETTNISETGHMDTELDKKDDRIIENTHKIEDTIENALKDPGIMDFVKNLINKGAMEAPKPGQPVIQPIEEKKDETIKPQKALKVKEVKKEDIDKSLEEQIKDLQETWVQTHNARKKEKLAKQIQELKKQQEKLKSNKGDE